MDAFSAIENSGALSPSDFVKTAWINSTTQIFLACFPAVGDAFMIAAIQQFNPYKITTYDAAAAFAASLGPSG